MAQSRKDSHGYALRSGECQRADGLIRTNPAAGVLGEIKKSHVWVKTKRKSLTVPEQKALELSLFQPSVSWMETGHHGFDRKRDEDR